MDGEKILDFIQKQGMNLFHGILVLVVGLFAVHWIMKLLERSEKLVHVEATMKGFLHNMIKLVLYVIVALTAANVIGIPLTSVVTLIASAGVAVSLAMQGALSNLVGGLTLLLLKPIRAGEYIKVGDYEGTVRTVGTFYTTVTTFDNRLINLPNSTLTNTAIVNFSREGTRRLDIVFSVSYGSDPDQVYKTLNDVIASNPAVLPEPAPSVVLSKMGDSSLEFTARLWVRTPDYWDVNFYMLDQGKRALDRAGIEIPFPQMDVHIRQDAAASSPS